MNKINNILLLTFVDKIDGDGIFNKILAQKEAFEKNGLNCKIGYYEKNEKDELLYKVENKTIENLGKGPISKLKRRYYYINIKKYIIKNKKNFDLIYFRYNQSANPFNTKLVKKISKSKIRLVSEIPTFPYDKEMNGTSLFQKINSFVEKIYRNKFFSYFERIITFSEDEIIYGKKTIKLINAIDLDKIIIQSCKNKCYKELNLIGVASIAYWHGYDRVIEGIYQYYNSHDKEEKLKVNFFIVGGNSNNQEYLKLKKTVKNYNLDKYIKFLGIRNGKELDKIFSISHVAIGSLGRHRSGIRDMQALKNMEYAARGIPFIYSENNYIFDNKPYILKFPADDNYIDINLIINFYNNLKLRPIEIRNTVMNYSWASQIKKLIDCLN